MVMRDQIERLLAPLRALLRSFVLKGLVDSVDDTGAMQVVTVVVGENETVDGLERVQPFGLTSVPKAGDEAIVIVTNGDPEHAVAIAVDASSRRPSGLAAGEVCVYRDPSNKILFKANGDVEILCEGKVAVKAGTIELGDGSAFKALLNEAMQSTFNTHTHAYLPGPGASTPTATPLPQSPATDLTTKTKAE